MHINSLESIYKLITCDTMIEILRKTSKLTIIMWTFLAQDYFIQMSIHKFSKHLLFEYLWYDQCLAWLERLLACWYHRWRLGAAGSSWGCQGKEARHQQHRDTRRDQGGAARVRNCCWNKMCIFLKIDGWFLRADGQYLRESYGEIQCGLCVPPPVILLWYIV